MGQFKSYNALYLLFFLLFIVSCRQGKENTENTSLVANDMEVYPNKTSNKPLSPEFKEYWYAGKAEITSYTLEQARYGEIRDGQAVLIYVTEPFLANKQVKADESHPSNVSVLKLNSTKKFLTGIYPYAIMNSSFYPVSDQQHAIKLSTSVQEWCGQVFTQLNNRKQFEINSFSYFESEGDRFFKLDKAYLENEIWNKIRINPNNLPVGAISMIPSLEYIRLSHKDLKAYAAEAKLDTKDKLSTYSITYPELKRTLSINFNSSFPYEIDNWTESYPSGSGANSQMLTTRANKIKTLKRAYWKENSNSDVFLRDSLGL
ncbi:septum formation inhibitor Maf [Arenibacter aquaticus]|uniref:Septum formation inhibitor Maf n=1 Tax=Arenibacter aquaticus TaxID=2489054 RepID=A0A3S0AKE7_9FLAO|nr:septum formation inhibitor Maf [Arenibacter aquaticus]RTE52215.1 septum formation inhibitor Maf [Arenibacter aquaticus]